MDEFITVKTAMIYLTSLFIFFCFITGAFLTMVFKKQDKFNLQCDKIFVGLISISDVLTERIKKIEKEMEKWKS